MQSLTYSKPASITVSSRNGRNHIKGIFSEEDQTPVSTQEDTEFILLTNVRSFYIENNIWVWQ